MPLSSKQMEYVDPAGENLPIPLMRLTGTRFNLCRMSGIVLTWSLNVPRYLAIAWQCFENEPKVYITSSPIL